MNYPRWPAIGNLLINPDQVQLIEFDLPEPGQIQIYLTGRPEPYVLTGKMAETARRWLARYSHPVEDETY